MKKEISFLLYNTPTENEYVKAILKNDTIWLTQRGMSELFGCSIDNVGLHLKNIYNEGELAALATAEDFSIVQQEGDREVKRNIKIYNLDAIISVGYRVSSKKATQFRIWATSILKEYMQKGFAVDEERLKQGETIFNKDYFKELLDIVRSIRASERRIWQQITDIFAECSVDYSVSAQETLDFYAMVQNKFHYAIKKQTAAEIVYNTADKDKQNMGLSTWKNSPDGRILKSDVVIAKNYLQEKEIKKLERLVSGYFDYVEDLIEEEHVFTMRDFASSINEFLTFRKYDVLEGSGKISKQQAQEKAANEYKEFCKTQKLNTDFDKAIKKLEQ